MISFLHNSRARTLPAVEIGSWASAASEAWRFHRTLPGFAETALVELPELAKRLAVGRIFVKDESTRLNLQSFKVLGVAYAVARLLAEQLGLDKCDLDFAKLRELTQRRFPHAVLTTATDGNHGKGLAWIATQLGLRSVIYLPQGAANSRKQAIEAVGGQAVETKLNYDQAVRFAASEAAAHGWWIVQDTAWSGYEQIPAWIMQGYTTMAREALTQLTAQAAAPSHLLLQAGVGSLAAAVQQYWLVNSQTDFRTVIMEPSGADCFYQSMLANDGAAHAVLGELPTIMAGLACGEPNCLAWPLLRDTTRAFASCHDRVAALGMRILGNPLPGDRPVVAGESGALGIGLLAALAWLPDLQADRERLGLDERSTVLLFNTEGATDPENYRRIVWGGQYPWP